MANCGCAGGSCSCRIEGDSGVEVTGLGTATNPYRIKARPLSMLVVDTATINLTLTGTGTTTDPYSLQADYIGSLPVPDQQPSIFQNWSGAVNLTSITAPTTIRATLNGNVTSVTLPPWGSTISGSINLLLTQDATGSRTWVQPGVSAGGVDVVLTTAANAKDLVRLFWTGAQWVVSAVALNVS